MFVSACIVLQSPARQVNDIQGDACRVFGPCDPKATQWRQGDIRYESLTGGLLGSGRVIPSLVYNRFLSPVWKVNNACKRTVMLFGAVTSLATAMRTGPLAFLSWAQRSLSSVQVHNQVTCKGTVKFSGVVPSLAMTFSERNCSGQLRVARRSTSTTAWYERCFACPVWTLLSSSPVTVHIQIWRTALLAGRKCGRDRDP